MVTEKQLHLPQEAGDHQPSETDSAVKLKTFQEFPKEMSPRLTVIRPNQRKSLLSAFYRLAAEKIELEKERKRTKESARKFRRKRILYSRIRSHFFNAVKSLERARALCRQGEFLAMWKAFASDGTVSFMKLICRVERWRVAGFE